MMNQVCFQVAWLSLIPGDAFHGNVLGQPIDAARGWARRARLILSEAVQSAFHGGDADLA